MIGVVVRELTYLKILAPIMLEIHNRGEEYVLYHFDSPRGSKEYNRARYDKIKLAFASSIENAKKVKAFSNDKQLQAQLVHDKILKLVSIEIWLWAKSYMLNLKKNNIKTYSILYLTDSLWQKDPACITSMDRVYYSTEYLMHTYHNFSSVIYNPNRDRCLGSPAFDPIVNKPSNGEDILVLLPNLRKEHVNISFGSSNNVAKIIEIIARSGDLIFKTRKKQWMPSEIKKYAKKIVDDGDIMYPPIMSSLLRQTYATVMFYSSGVYECVYGGNYIVNIPLPLKRWNWDKAKMNQYFSTTEGNVYQFDGVVKSISQNDVLGGKFLVKSVDFKKREEWLKKFVNQIYQNSSREIVKDILK